MLLLWTAVGGFYPAEQVGDVRLFSAEIGGGGGGGGDVADLPDQAFRSMFHLSGDIHVRKNNSGDPQSINNCRFAPAAAEVQLKMLTAQRQVRAGRTSIASEHRCLWDELRWSSINSRRSMIISVSDAAVDSINANQTHLGQSWERVTGTSRTAITLHTLQTRAWFVFGWKSTVLE